MKGTSILAICPSRQNVADVYDVDIFNGWDGNPGVIRWMQDFEALLTRML